MTIDKILTKVASEGGEVFISARDEKHAESLRVTAFNYRRKMPLEFYENVGINKVQEDGKWFLRIFDRKIEGAQIWRRDKETGKLVPVKEEASQESIRMRELMRKDGVSEEEIERILKE